MSEAFYTRGRPRELEYPMTAIKWYRDKDGNHAERNVTLADAGEARRHGEAQYKYIDRWWGVPDRPRKEA